MRPAAVSPMTFSSIVSSHWLSAILVTWDTCPDITGRAHGFNACDHRISVKKRELFSATRILMTETDYRMLDKAQRLYEQVLVLRCQAGDDYAFAELVERYRQRLDYYVCRLLDDHDQAGDVMQNVWLTVYRKISTLRQPRALSVWLYRIAHNAAMAEMRNVHRWDELTEEPRSSDTDRDEPDFSPDDAERIHAALGRLCPRYREVLVLRFLEDLSYEDIAEVAGCPLGTVRSRLHYAKRELRREMGD